MSAQEESASEVVPIRKVPSSNRINNLEKLFLNTYGCKPLFYARVPGRVNIIGEHIDYCGYPVLPMALEQDIIIAAALLKEPKLYICNVDSKYKQFETDIKCFEEIEIVTDLNGKPFWYNYVLCGIKGGLEFIENKIMNGLQLYIDGNIPPASGLSSSSALVSASCLSFLFGQNIILNKTDIANLCANSERYIGTQGGGMDQAIAFLAEKYCAQYISWQPLRATPVALPENITFVVAHSMAEANKAATNDFNRRVIECRLAAKILSTSEEVVPNRKILTLSQVQKSLDKSLEDMVKLVHKILPKDIYTKSEVCNLLQITEAEINDSYLTPNTIHISEFKLKQRALHVYEEAIRVEKFRKICLQKCNGNNGNISYLSNENGSHGSHEILNILGNLIAESHYSLKTLYECSHENLDHLVNISKDVSVYSRLTGAGWGGCVVALCSKDNAEKYVATLINEFYKKHCNIDEANAHSYVFVTTPNHGAEIYK